MEITKLNIKNLTLGDEVVTNVAIHETIVSVDTEKFDNSVKIGTISVDNTVFELSAPYKTHFELSDIIFSSDFTFEGDYVLGLKKPTPASTYTMHKNDTLLDFFNEFFIGTDTDDAIVTDPSFSVSFTTDVSPKEIGTKITPKFKVIFIPGSYSYGSIAPDGSYNSGTGVVYNKITAIDSNGKTWDDITSGIEYSADECEYVETGYTYELTVTTSWSNGYDVATKLHKKSTTRTPIVGQTKSMSINIPAGTRTIKTYYYVGTDRDTPVNKEFLKMTTTGHSFDNGTILTKTFEVPYKSTRIVYAIPGDHEFQKLEVPGLGEVTYNDETFELPYDNDIITIDGMTYRVIQYKAHVGSRFPDLTLKFTFI